MSEEYLNYWLKKTVKETPNDMELGNKVRELMSNNPKQSTNLKSEENNIFGKIKGGRLSLIHI